MTKQTAAVDFDRIKSLEYNEFMKMMCNHKKNIKKGLCVTFGTGQIKNFLSMKKNVERWFNRRTDKEQCRIITYLSTC